MGYCDSQWISDYTWSAMFDRTLAVSALAISLPPEDRVVVRLIDGEATLVGTRAIRAPHTHEMTPFAYLNAAGHTLLEGNAPTVLQSHSTERLVVLPNAPRHAVSVRVDGVDVAL